MLFSIILAGCSQPEVNAPTVKPSESLVEMGSAYHEPYRPQFHFSPPSMWMNDPNGMVFFEDEYHLFYQYYPEDTVWGPMHWGHAVSDDLVHWRHLPIALYPDELGYIFSGSAVVDWHNSSGFGIDGKPPMVAVFTYHDPKRAEKNSGDHETQGIAYSNDRGRTWTKFEGNPVLPNVQKLKDFRDPKVFWHEDTQRWVMSLSATNHVQFWSSPDLKHWSYLSDFGREWGAHGGVWECPDLIEMMVEGSDETRWVLILNLNPGGPQGGSGTQYFVGDFDGRHFRLDSTFKQTLRDEGAVWLDAGRDNYAGVTWSNVPEDDGRVLFIGWMSNWDYAQRVPTHPWRSALTLPRELVLTRSESSGYRVFSRPVAELQSLRQSSHEIKPARIPAGYEITLLDDETVMQTELQLNFELPESAGFDVGVEFSNALNERYRFGLNGTESLLYSDRVDSGDFSFSAEFPGVHQASRLSSDRRLSLRMFIDAASVEVFVDGGANVLTDTVFPSEPFSKVAVYAEGADLFLRDGRAWTLERIWE